MKKLLLTLSAAVLVSSLPAHADPAKPIPVLDAFAKCDIAALKAIKAPVVINKQFKVVKITTGNENGNDTAALVFSKKTEGLLKNFSESSGYPFDKQNKVSRGLVVIDGDTSDGTQENKALTCTKF